MNIDAVNGLACIKSHTDIKGDLTVYPLPLKSSKRFNW